MKCANEVKWTSLVAFTGLVWFLDSHGEFG